MKIISVEFLHHRLAFKGEFQHARRNRAHGDNILVRVVTEKGTEGFGEILPRPYVTGESVASIMGYDGDANMIASNLDVDEDCAGKSQAGVDGEALAMALIGVRLLNQGCVSNWISDTHAQYPHAPALFGGIELALWNAFASEEAMDLDTLLGPLRKSIPGHCITIGFDAGTSQLRARAVHARLQRASVVKLKIGREDDVERLQELNSQLKGNLPIRVDANASYAPDQMALFLEGAKGSALQSVEEPLNHTYSVQKRSSQMKSLFKEYSIPFLADESLCTREDALQLLELGGFQGFNLRVGKHGGLQATREIRDMAVSANLSLVSGSMVGETGVLTQASQLLLSRSECLAYVEGLGQNRSFLHEDPVQLSPENPNEQQGLRMRPIKHCIPPTSNVIVKRRSFGAVPSV